MTPYDAWLEQGALAWHGLDYEDDHEVEDEDDDE